MGGYAGVAKTETEAEFGAMEVALGVGDGKRDLVALLEDAGAAWTTATDSAASSATQGTSID